jgi:hypothetical protein
MFAERVKRWVVDERRLWEAGWEVGRRKRDVRCDFWVCPGGFGGDSLEGISPDVAQCLELKEYSPWGVFPLTKVCA